MTSPRRLVVVASVHHGNTLRVAEAIAGVLEAQVVTAGAVVPERLVGLDLVGFGTGVYYGRPHESLLAPLRRLPDAPAPMQPAFVFSTSGLPFLSRVWHTPLERLLARKGFEVIGSFACRGFDTWGPLWLTGGLHWSHPDERDLERARAFAKSLVPEKNRVHESVR